MTEGLRQRGIPTDRLTSEGRGLTEPDRVAREFSLGPREQPTTEVGVSLDLPLRDEREQFEKQYFLHHIRRCISSLYTGRAIAYRANQGFDDDQVAISVGVQKMANSFTAGVMFTLHPANGDRLIAFSLFGEVFISEDAGESWTKVAREFGEIRAAAWLPGSA